MSSNDRGLAKRLKTFRERFGGNAPICCPDVRAKIQATNLERYGAKTPFESKAIREKCKQTIREKYGVDNAGSCLQVITKRQHTIRDHTFDRYRTVLRQTHNIELVSTRDQFINDEVLTYTCNNCGRVWSQQRQIPQIVICSCADHPNNDTYKKQGMINYIRSIYHRSIITDYQLGPYTIDLYVPEYNVGFRWVDNWNDNELFRDRTYNRNLSDYFRNNGIRVVHVFEYLWRANPIKMQNLVNGALHYYSNVLYARNCEIRPISSSMFHQFLLDNHLGNYVHASTRLGLFNDNQLVSIAGFGKGRYTKGIPELYRYCVKSGHRVVGGLSKLITHCPFDTVFSYVDKACFTGNGYLASGFKLIGETKACGYVYSNGRTTYDRISCQKHLQLKKFGHVDDNLTESENMAINGFYRVFDCGAYRFQWNRC